MSTRASSATLWDGRIARARELAAGDTPARETLRFYAELAEFQRSLVLSAAEPTAADDFLQAVDVDGAATAVPFFLVWLQRTAPRALALAAAAMGDEDMDWGALMRASLASDAVATADTNTFAETKAFVIDAVLQPFAEAAAKDGRRERSNLDPSTSGLFQSRCPICSSLPSVGFLREEGQGAKRLLVCARCLSEWAYLRVVCVSCGEEKFDALPVYTTDEFAHVRIEACDTCRHYVKTIDLTINGLAVPIVDDIASVPLDLWAREQGYRRLRSNLLRANERASGDRV